MPEALFINIPFGMVAGVAVAIVAFLLVAYKAGLSLNIMTIIGLSVVAGALAFLTFILDRRLRQQAQASRQTRMLTERLQALLSVTPGGYCLFTPQGLLREAVHVPHLLGIDKVAHIEDIVGALKEPTDFIADFRRLQRTGASFTVQVETTQEAKPVQITGRRFRAGREGPLIDVVWFNDNPVTARALEKQMVELSAIGQRARDVLVLLDSLPFPVWGRGKDLNLSLCNNAYVKAVDSTEETVLREQLELTSPTARSGSGRALAEKALSEGQMQLERRHVIVDGKRRLLEITEMPLKAADPSGDTVLLGFAVDVTAEEDKDAELQRHVGAQNEVLEHLGSAIVIYGPDMRIEFYNRAYLRLWDADEAFLNSKPTFGEVLEDLRTRRRAPEQADFQRYKKERTALFTSLLEPREDLMHLPDGTSLRILAVPHPFGGIMFVHEDVTDKLALESSYNTLIAVQRETLDNLAEGSAVFGPDGKLRLFNPAFARIWKLEPEFLETNPHVADLLEEMKPLFNFGDNWNDFKNEMVAYTLDRSARRGRIERADNSVIEYITVPLPDGAVLNSYLDVSDSVRVEQALRASNAALAAADRLKSEFVANVSYQLRTPLNTIMGFAEILTNQYFGTLNERQMEYTRTMMEASKKLLLLINDVLDLATIEAGRMALNREAIDIADLLNTAKQIAAEWARRQSLEILIDCPSGIGAFEADESRMKQVLFNLISNAIKFTPPGGRITLEARREEPWVVLTVADTGVGIPEADRERVFGKFERTNVQARQGGAGLGLSLVKSFVELHGGRIEIASEVNQGTRISCWLPTQQAEAVQGPEAAA
ncbi:MAG: ATP-binding protein [Alphaproteobacteria bacterium]|nr:ATP-binding protein [Alphaproteobacteria bacterium]